MAVLAIGVGDAHEFSQIISEGEGPKSVAPALSECLRCGGHLHHQTMFAVLHGHEVEMLVKSPCFIVKSINDDKPPSPNLGGGNPLTQRVEE
jgi:hypothetical protein